MTGRFLEILTELHDHGVDFVIVGGVAAALHGGSRATFDLDIVPSLAPDDPVSPGAVRPKRRSAADRRGR